MITGMDKVLIVGDIHGEWGKLNKLINNKEPDIVIQCGDFGWWPKMEHVSDTLYNRRKGNKWKLKGVKPGNSKVYWCDGNHEDHSMIKQNGYINEVYDNVYHASRGSTLELKDGRTILFIGGSDSIDKKYRTPSIDWFFEENISLKEFERAMNVDKKIDIIISHTCPYRFPVIEQYKDYGDCNRYALDLILKKHKPDKWYFGHWHQFKEGEYLNTKWTCLDYPSHRGRWWVWL